VTGGLLFGIDAMTCLGTAGNTAALGAAKSLGRQARNGRCGP
jgi:hypothetical protein